MLIYQKGYIVLCPLLLKLAEVDFSYGYNTLCLNEEKYFQVIVNQYVTVKFRTRKQNIRKAYIHMTQILH